MMHACRKTFKGGFIFPRLEGEPEAQIDELSIPNLLRVPLAQGIAAACEAVVKVGDRVRCGQLIGKATTERSFPVHAPASGIVKEVSEVTIGGISVPAVCIEPDGTSGEEVLCGATGEFERIPAEDIQDLLHASGVSALFFEGFPSRAASCAVRAEQVKVVAIAALAT